MNQKQVIITKFSIGIPKQIKMFQVRIPRHVDKITSVTMSCLWAHGSLPLNTMPSPWQIPFAHKRNVLIGDLKLQSYEQSNVFYTGELKLNYNTNEGDFSSLGFEPKVYTHEAIHQANELNVSGKTTLLQGIYKDEFHSQATDTYRYLVTIYIWTELK